MYSLCLQPAEWPEGWKEEQARDLCQTAVNSADYPNCEIDTDAIVENCVADIRVYCKLNLFLENC